MAQQQYQWSIKIGGWGREFDKNYFKNIGFSHILSLIAVIVLYFSLHIQVLLAQP